MTETGGEVIYLTQGVKTVTGESSRSGQFLKGVSRTGLLQAGGGSDTETLSTKHVETSELQLLFYYARARGDDTKTKS